MQCGLYDISLCDAAHIFYDSDYAAGIARGRYKSNTNAEIAKRVQKLAREENARRSVGGRDGIVWRHPVNGPLEINSPPPSCRANSIKCNVPTVKYIYTLCIGTVVSYQ
jgi:hypothetical protein